MNPEGMLLLIIEALIYKSVEQTGFSNGAIAKQANFFADTHAYSLSQAVHAMQALYQKYIRGS
jgi:hypothetical protein